MSISFKSALTFAAAVATSTLLVSSAAMASAPGQPVVVTATRSADVDSRQVPYRDLDLTLARDQRRLDRRVDVAVKDVCVIDDYYATRTLGSYYAYRSCSDVAWNGARPQIAAAIEQARTGLAEPGAVASVAITVSARTGG